MARGDHPNPFSNPRDPFGDVSRETFGRLSDISVDLLPHLLADLSSALDAVTYARLHLPTVLPSLDEWQETAARSLATGLLLLCGRQTGKSTLSALLAAHMATTWPGTTTLLLSPTLRQSAELFRKTMTLVDAMADCPQVKRRTQTELLLANKSKIHSLPGSNPESIRGFSAIDLLVEDESAFVADKTFVATRPFFATNPYGRHILLTTPFGKRGHFYELWSGGDEHWQRITIKSADCPRISAEFLANERANLSDRAYRQEYECEFLEAAEAVFPDDWLERLVDQGERTTIDPARLVHLVSAGDDANVWAGLE